MARQGVTRGTSRRSRRSRSGLIALAALGLLAAGCLPPGARPPTNLEPAFLVIDPMGASFTDTPSGDSDIAEFTVLNVGDQPTGPVDAFFADFSGVGDFTGLTDCLGAVLGSGASCTIVVAYENNTGHDGGGATVVADADPGGTATAAVSGVGQPDPSGNELELSPANASLSDTPDSPGTTQVFDLVNQSSGPVTQINFSVIEDAGQGSFLIAAEDCDTLLTNDQC